ncbi:unnamed protein product [Linum tenue]|uniref:Pentatricopeptide repeat-containing protein n=1 Tax=Linum tenue TaxID=586396 RepID=A0AAV0JA07_9ROSI|nr:unnamed protein product [Linum tenue]
MWRNPGRLIGNGRRTWTGRQLSTAAPESSYPGPGYAARQPRLYRILSALGATGGTVTKALNDYLMEGRAIRKIELMRCVKELRKYGRFDHSLEIMDWMEKRGINFAHGDLGVRLDLICKTKGIKEAESYFNGLPELGKSTPTYGSLLNCYCKELDSEKALQLFGKMDELQLIKNSLPFNNVMSLYMRLRQPEKVPDLVTQMKQKNIAPCTFTYNVWMQSLGQLKDMEGVDKVLEEMRGEGEDKTDWTTYSNLAAVYSNAGDLERARSALKMLEQKIDSPNRDAYHFLITLYAGTGDLEEVHRVWGCIKSKFHQVTNSSYLVMVLALARLKDVEGVSRVFEEWESVCSTYDMRIANAAIKLYLEQGMYEEAEMVFDGATKRTQGPYFRAREMMMISFLKRRQLESALQQMKAAFSEIGVNKKPWRPGQETVAAFFSFFEEEKDVSGAEKLVKILMQIEQCDYNVYSQLLKTYVAAGESAPGMRERLEGDGIEVDEELKKLLDMVEAA